MNIIMKILKYSSIILFFILLVWIGRNYVGYDTKNLRDWIISFGIFSPLIYLVLCSLRPFIFFPMMILSIAGGLAFGVLLGTLLTITGTLIGASLTFMIVRKFGHQFQVQQWNRTQKLQKSIDERGFYYVVFLRVIPFLNYDLVSIASGLSNVGFRPYIAGTLCGMIPGVFLLNFFGSSLATGNMKQIVAILTVIVIIALISYIIKRLQKKSRSPIDLDR
ncbi:TVP38/TMEM64 family protein [Pseudalkalibacillus sp. R45]